jgi:hypothetical protein
MNLRDYYNAEYEYTIKEYNNFRDDSSDSNRQKVLNKRARFKTKYIKEVKDLIVHYMDVRDISNGMIDTTDRIQDLYKHLAQVERIDE